MDEDTAKGLTTFLNSTILDEHFRVFSGHTQVNATDLRNMRYPSRELLRKLGQRAKGQPDDQATIDRLLEGLETPHPQIKNILTHPSKITDSIKVYLPHTRLTSESCKRGGL